MSDSHAFDFDPNLLSDFLAESKESLNGIDELFVQLEEEPNNVEIVDEIFRPVHSIKGNSALFGMSHIKKFAHEMESLLGDMRMRRRNPNRKIIDVLLTGADSLRDMIDRIASGDSSTDLTQKEQESLEAIRAILATRADNLTFDGEEKDPIAMAAQALDGLRLLNLPEEAKPFLDILSKAIDSSLGLGSKLDRQSGPMMRLGPYDVTDPMNIINGFIDELRAVTTPLEEHANRFRRAVGRIRTVAEPLGDTDTLTACDDLLNEFQTIYESGLTFDRNMVDELRVKLENVAANMQHSTESGHFRKLDDSQISFDDIEPPADLQIDPHQDEVVESIDEKDKDDKSKDSQAKDSHAHAPSKTLRIDEEKVDAFMSFVGELIITGEVFAYIQKKLEPHHDVRQISQEFKNANIAFGELSMQLQKSLMAVRRLPLRNIFQKIPRTVRDLAAHLGKEVELEITGGDVQIDKSILERLESPIIHMVRNSIDHGLEFPDEREANGKPRVGQLKISAVADEERFRLSITDDGVGLDLKKIKAKAIEKGHITEIEAETMPDSLAYQLIFGAGISTAGVVTEVSGRGVGMDVVRNNVEEMNGHIDIETELGKFTTFTLVLPMSVTLTVVDGLVSRIGDANYIVPIADVRESLRPREGQISTITGKGEMLNVRGELHRIIRLYRLIDQIDIDDDVNPRDPYQSTIILVQTKRGSCGLLVDEVIGQQSVVLKKLGAAFPQLRIIKGAAILGDARVGLVLDTEGIMMT